ncbi:DUF5990 family protein [Hufsiella ginkgonis]|uniref:Uncharacterized protein n=1 Tax=Hufsiella ginkgonis TaxID=2695274 RepID=A0A7K1XX33_9SPHI|nr:DUF5990 family protein [Hufsiella ginkgonis]MXV15502.1 hypothetical protein [Hufsiella ginkgonis]
MNQEFICRIVLESPNEGVDFSLQEGGGNNYKIVQKQRSDGANLVFECIVRVKQGKDDAPDFLGKQVHGATGDRFIYIDIGKSAGQWDSEWTRRLKVPLRGIGWDTVNILLNEESFVLQAQVPGKGSDGTPNCATVKPFKGWKLENK